MSDTAGREVRAGSGGSPVPELTDEQRRAALGRAAERRRGRADLLARVKAGEVTLAEVFEMADAGDELVLRTSVTQLLGSLPGVGPRKAQRALRELGIGSVGGRTRRVRGLGPRQRAALVERFCDGRGGR